MGDLRRRRPSRGRCGRRARARAARLNRAARQQCGCPRTRNLRLDVDPETIERVLETNYLGGVWCARAFLPGLRSAAAAGDAHVVNVVSVAGTIAFAPAGPYAGSKHAQLAFSRSLAATLRPRGDPGAHAHAGVRRDRGLHPSARSCAAVSCAASCSRPDDVATGDREGGREGTQGRDDGAVVPLPPGLDLPGALPRASSRGSSAATATARARRTSCRYMPGLRATYQPTSISYGAAGAGPRIR